jgi:hypothetical protein
MRTAVPMPLSLRTALRLDYTHPEPHTIAAHHNNLLSQDDPGRDAAAIQSSADHHTPGYADLRYGMKTCGGGAVSARSVGGAAGARGVGLQDRVFAWAAVAMLSERPLAGALLPGTAVRVGAQTGFSLDDVAVETDRGGFALVQAKVGLGLGPADDSPLARALGQALDQYLGGLLPVAGGAPRQVEAGLDALVICTDRQAPASVREDLPAAIRRTASQPPGIAFGFELTVGQVAALTVLTTHAKRLWKLRRRKDPSDEEIRTFLAILYVIAVDALDGEPEYAASLAALDPLVPAGQSQAAWQILVAQGHEASERRQWRNRNDLAIALVNAGIDIRPGQQYQPDIGKLRALTASNLTLLAPATMLPVATGVHLPRLVSRDLDGTAVADGAVLIVGDAGAGKTGVAVGLAHQRQGIQDVVLLQAGDLVGGSTSGSLGLPLDQILTAWVGTASATLIIDGLDAARGSRDRARLAELVQAFRGTRWQVVATVRTLDALYSPALRGAFAGQPVSAEPERVDPRLSGVRHLLVADLTDAELAPGLDGVPELAGFLATAGGQLTQLLHNPFNLRLAVELLTGPIQLSTVESGRLSRARSRLDLLDAYWAHRVDSQDATARADLLTRVCEQMLTTRELWVAERLPAVLGTDGAAVDDLLSANVLTLDAQAISGAVRVLVFAHNILFDFAAARYVLLDPLDPCTLAIRLDEDPSLPLVARPSLDLVIERLWNQQDRSGSWRLALKLAGGPHLLASLAVAARLLLAAPEPAELQILADALTGGDAGTLAAARLLTAQIAGALRAPVTPDQRASAAVPGTAWLARELARSAGASGRWDEAALSADLLGSLERRAPLRPGGPGAADRAATVATLLDACRADPQRFEGIAGAATGHLPGAVAAEPVVAQAVARLLDDAAAMSQWGGTVLAPLADALPALLAADPALARRTALAIWTFNEPRDEPVSLLGLPLLPMRESRRQQARRGAYVLGQVYPRLCGADPVSAAQIFADIADTGLHAPAQGSDPSRDWPLTAGEANGWLQYGQRLDVLGGHAAVRDMAQALRDVLASRGADGTEPGQVVALLAANLQNVDAWAALLEPGDNPVGLARAVLPTLASGSLMAHPETHENACRLLAALASISSPDLASALEQAVEAAGQRAAANGLPGTILDELLGCLNPSAVTSTRLASRLEELTATGGPPPLAPRSASDFHRSRHTLLDAFAEAGVQVPQAVAATVRALDDELTVLQNGSTDERPERQRRLPERFLAADAAIAASGIDHQQLRMLLLRAACELARDDRALPDTPAGQRAAALLLDAARGNDAGEFL